MIVDITHEFLNTSQTFRTNELRQSQDLQSSQRLSSSSSRQSQKQQSLPIESQLYNRYALDIHDSLLKISIIMRESKENYFSNAAYSYAAFTDQQRNEFDMEIRASLESGNRKISELNEIIDRSLHRSITEKSHMKSVVMCLYQMFKSVSGEFKLFLEFNQVKKQKILSTIAMQSKREGRPSQIKKRISLVDEELEEESKLVYMEKVSEQKKIEDTRRTLQNITQILSEMSNKVLEQELLTSSFMEIGETGLFHLDKGNQQLVKANQLSKESGKHWTYYFLFLAVSLLIFDFIKS